MKQLCLATILVFLIPNVYGATKSATSKTLTKNKINIKTTRTIKTVEKNVKQVEKNLTRTINNQIRNIQRNIKTPTFNKKILVNTSQLSKGFQKPKVPSFAKGTTLLTKELAKIDPKNLLSAPIILKSPIKQDLKPTKSAVTNKGLTVAKKNTPNVNKGLTNTPKLPKVVFVLPVPPVAKKITLPAPLARR